MPANRLHLEAENWHELIYLAHLDRARAFDAYSSYYLTTSGQYYWSDEHQMSTYVPDYHDALASRLVHYAHGSEMITEIYVPREKLARFLSDVRSDFLANQTDLIYGTIRLIEADGETKLQWAKQSHACVIFNLHVAPDAAGIEKAKREFLQLIDRGLSYGGSYYLTYHRWAEPRQVIAASLGGGGAIAVPVLVPCAYGLAMFTLARIVVTRRLAFGRGETDADAEPDEPPAAGAVIPIAAAPRTGSRHRHASSQRRGTTSEARTSQDEAGGAEMSLG